MLNNKFPADEIPGPLLRTRCLFPPETGFSLGISCSAPIYDRLEKSRPAAHYAGPALSGGDFTGRRPRGPRKSTVNARLGGRDIMNRMNSYRPYRGKCVGIWGRFCAGNWRNWVFSRIIKSNLKYQLFLQNIFCFPQNWLFTKIHKFSISCVWICWLWKWRHSCVMTSWFQR